MTAVPAYYDVQLQLGSWSRTVVGGTEQDWTQPVVLDGLTMGWAWESDEWPGAQLEPLQAQLQVAVRDVALLEQVQQGDLASVRLRSFGGVVQGAVHGRLIEWTAEQVRRRDPDGVVRVWTIYTGQLVSHDAADTETVTALLDQLPPDFRWQQLVDACAAPIEFPQVDRTGEQLLVAEQLDEARVVDVLRDHYRSVLTAPNAVRYPNDPAPAGRLFVMAPLARSPFSGYGTPGELVRYAPLVVRNAKHTEAPLYLGRSGGSPDQLTLKLATTPSTAGQVPADQVELGGTWRQGPEGQADAVTVRVPASPEDSAGVGALAEYAVTEYAPGKTSRTAVNRREVPGKHGDPADARAVARALIPERVPGRWDRESFVWHPPLGAAQLGQRFFPNLEGYYFGGDGDGSDPAVQFQPHPLGPNVVPPCFVAPVAVVGLPTSSNVGRLPGGVYAGQLRSCSLQLRDGRLVVTFALRRSLARLEYDGATSPNQRLTYALARAATDVNWARYDDVDPTLTLRDLRLARRNVNP